MANTVIVKDPAKPGYMSTEFWAMVIYGLKTLGITTGLSPETASSTVSSFSDIIGKMGDDPKSNIMLGVVIVVYTLIRGYLKRAKINAEAQLEITEMKLGGKRSPE
jgi:hypothetical protein